MVTETIEVASIANGASLSGAVNLKGGRLVAIMMPSAWTAADLTFQASTDGASWYDMYDEYDAEVTVQAAASRYILVEPARWLGVRQIKVRSGASAAAVAQGAARSINLVLVD